jgi:methionine biosynthesis protein MetW
VSAALRQAPSASPGRSHGERAQTRYDFELIASWIPERARVLDLGCGDGVLLAGLSATHGVAGYGVEIDEAGVLASVRNGVNVIQMDMETGLSTFGDGAFDFVILSQTLQAMRNVELIMREMLRVGREGIVTFPNFGYWRHRLDIFLGHMPVSKTLPHAWWNTPNIHLCTVKDFEDLCVKVDAKILDERVIHEGRTIGVFPNLLGSLGVFRFRRK